MRGVVDSAGSPPGPTGAEKALPCGEVGDGVGTADARRTRGVGPFSEVPEVPTPFRNLGKNGVVVSNIILRSPRRARSEGVWGPGDPGTLAMLLCGGSRPLFNYLGTRL